MPQRHIGHILSETVQSFPGLFTRRGRGLREQHGRSDGHCLPPPQSTVVCASTDGATNASARADLMMRDMFNIWPGTRVEMQDALEFAPQQEQLGARAGRLSGVTSGLAAQAGQ